MKKTVESLRKFKRTVGIIMAAAMLGTAYADGETNVNTTFNPLDAIHTFADLMIAMAQGIGIIGIIWAIIEFGISYYQHDKSAALTGVIALFGGALLFSTPWLLQFLGITY